MIKHDDQFITAVKAATEKACIQHEYNPEAITDD